MKIVSDSLSIDTNLLVYAFDEASPFHNQSKLCLEYLTSGNRKFNITWQVLLEFYAVVTNSSHSNKVTSPEAWEFINGLLESGYVDLIYPNSETYKVFSDLLNKKKYLGARVFDLFLASTLLSNGITQLITQNTKDFSEIFNLKTMAIPDFEKNLIT